MSSFLVGDLILYDEYDVSFVFASLLQRTLVFTVVSLMWGKVDALLNSVWTSVSLIIQIQGLKSIKWVYQADIRIWLVLFCIFLIFKKSHKKIKTNSVLVRFSILSDFLVLALPSDPTGPCWRCKSLKTAPKCIIFIYFLRFSNFLKQLDTVVCLKHYSNISK